MFFKDISRIFYSVGLEALRYKNTRNRSNTRTFSFYALSALKIVGSLPYFLTASLIVSLSAPTRAQLSITPQFNTALPVGDTREYGNPRTGYGLEVGYQLSKHFGVVVAYDRYRFELQSDLEDFNINSTIVSLFNLPDLLSLDMTAASWNGGVRFSWPLRHVTPYLGAEGSTNLITAEGFGLRVSRRYWGVAPVAGVEVALAPRWSLRADTRLQTIFIEEDIPFVEDIIDETLMFVPLQVGVVFRLNF